MSNEKGPLVGPGGFVGDEILPSYAREDWHKLVLQPCERKKGIIRNHYKDPY